MILYAYPCVMPKKNFYPLITDSISGIYLRWFNLSIRIYNKMFEFILKKLCIMFEIV